MKQWEIWKAKSGGLEKDHWYVLISPQEVIDSGDPLLSQLNALLCRSLRSGAAPKPQDVVLNSAEGFDHKTVVACHHVFSIPKDKLRDRVGTVTPYRQKEIARTLRAMFRLAC